MERLEREARRRKRTEAEGKEKLHFIFGGGPEEKAAIEAGEKILRFDYGGKAQA